MIGSRSVFWRAGRQEKRRIWREIAEKTREREWWRNKKYLGFVEVYGTDIYVEVSGCKI